jgi:polyphenol oxidase
MAFIESNWIKPDWPAPENIKAFCTTRKEGVSEGAYAHFNLAAHVDDNHLHVKKNRQLLSDALNLPVEPVWLEQVHGVHIINADTADKIPQADASFSTEKNKVCVVMTADCLPVLLCNKQGTKVAAAHAGWRGLQAGVIEASINALEENTQDILVWLGPAIGPQAFEVGDEVRQKFIQEIPETALAFIANKPGHWLANIYQLAKIRLQKMGIEKIYGGDFCTYTDQQRFYSYRRDGATGRMASLIWRT